MSRGIKAFVLAALATVAGAAPASACLTVGVYQNNPASLASLQRGAGHGISMLSTYLTAGHALPRSVIATANRDHAGLLVTWEPDGGTDTAIASACWSHGSQMAGPTL